MVRPWEHQMRQAELVNTVQTLHLWAAQEAQEHTIKAHAAMHAIMDNFEARHLGKIL